MVGELGNLDVQQAAEHLKKRQEIEAELEQSRETASALQKRVLFMDDQLTNAENETELLRSQLMSNEVNRGNTLSPTAGSWRKSFAGVAESFSRSLSDGVGEPTRNHCLYGAGSFEYLTALLTPKTFWIFCATNFDKESVSKRAINAQLKLE